MKQIMTKKLISKKKIIECPSCKGTGHNREDVGGMCWDCLGQGYIEIEVDKETKYCVGKYLAFDIHKNKMVYRGTAEEVQPYLNDTVKLYGSIIKDTTPEFLVVYEDVWNNKVSVRTTKIGDTIVKLSKEHDFVYENVNIEKLNSKDPYQAGITEACFYDIDVKKTTDDETEEYGRIMIFTL